MGCRRDYQQLVVLVLVLVLVLLLSGMHWIQEKVLVVGKAGVDEAVRSHKQKFQRQLADLEAKLLAQNQERVAKLEANIAALRKAGDLDKDALVRAEARGNELQRELAAARDVRLCVAAVIFFLCCGASLSLCLPACLSICLSVCLSAPPSSSYWSGPF